MLKIHNLLPCISVIAFVTSVFSQTSQHDSSSPIEQSFFAQAHLCKKSLLSFHKQLVNIESISGNEHAVGEFLESHLKAHNYTVEKQYVDPLPINILESEPEISKGQKQRFNLLAYPGESRQSRLLLSSHLDTVPPFYGYEVRAQDQIWGRGSVDAKACIATQIYAVQELLEAGEISPNDVSLLFVVGEETGGDGMRRVNDLSLDWETVIFGEPTELKLASGHKGILIFSVKAHGHAGHSGYPWLGENANHILIPALMTLQKLELPRSKKYGNSTLNIGRVHGGVAANVIAEDAEATIGIRIADGSPEIVEKMIVDALKDMSENLEVKFHDGSYGPVDIDSHVEGFETITVNYGTDIPNLNGTHKKYLYGPGNVRNFLELLFGRLNRACGHEIGIKSSSLPKTHSPSYKRNANLEIWQILVAHSDHEHLIASDLLAAVEGYKKLIKAALKS